MSTAKIYRDKKDYVVDVDGTIYRGMKVTANRMPDGRYSLRVYDPAFTILPKPSRARMYHNDYSLMVDRIEDYTK